MVTSKYLRSTYARSLASSNVDRWCSCSHSQMPVSIRKGFYIHLVRAINKLSFAQKYSVTAISIQCFISCVTTQPYSNMRVVFDILKNVTTRHAENSSTTFTGPQFRNRDYLETQFTYCRWNCNTTLVIPRKCNESSLTGEPSLLVIFTIKLHKITWFHLQFYPYKADDKVQAVFSYWWYQYITKQSE